MMLNAMLLLCLLLLQKQRASDAAVLDITRFGAIAGVDDAPTAAQNAAALSAALTAAAPGDEVLVSDLVVCCASEALRRAGGRARGALRRAGGRTRAGGRARGALRRAGGRARAVRDVPRPSRRGSLRIRAGPAHTTNTVALRAHR